MCEVAKVSAVQYDSVYTVSHPRLAMVLEARKQMGHLAGVVDTSDVPCRGIARLLYILDWPLDEPPTTSRAQRRPW